VISFFEAINKLEGKFEHSYSTGVIYCIVSIVIAALLISLSRMIMPNLPNLEILFVVYLIAFLLNYYLVRAGKILPYLENDEENFTAKITGFFGLFAIIFYFYAMQYLNKNLCIFALMASWIISYVIEKLFFKY